MRRGLFSESDSHENLYLLPGEVENESETKTNHTSHFWKAPTSLDYILEETGIKTSGRRKKKRKRKKKSASRPQQTRRTNTKTSRYRPLSASTGFSYSSTASPASHSDVQRNSQRKWKTRVEVILEEYAKLRESEQRREERVFREVIETELKNNHHPGLLTLNPDSSSLDSRPSSAKVYRSRLRKTKTRCQSLRTLARKFHTKNKARSRRSKRDRSAKSKSTRLNPAREYVLFQSSRFKVRHINSGEYDIPCSVTISEEPLVGFKSAALLVRVWPLLNLPHNQREAGSKEVREINSKECVCLRIKLRELRVICQHSTSVSAVLARCTFAPGMSTKPVRLADFMLKPGGSYPHAIGRQISFQLGQCVMQALSLYTYPFTKLVVTDRVCAATRLQAHVRRWLHGTSWIKQKQAITKVQRQWRMHSALRLFHVLTAQKRRAQLRCTSSIKIQYFWRHSVRLRNRKKAAIMLQRSWRVTTRRRTNSALAIQCYWRRCQAIKIWQLLMLDEKKREQTALWLQSHYRRIEVEKSVRRRRAASTLQSCWRRYVSYRRIVEVKRQFAELNYNYRYVIDGAITKMQRRWRERTRLQQFAKLGVSYHRVITKLQRQWRQYYERTRQQHTGSNNSLSKTIAQLKNRYQMSTKTTRLTRQMTAFMGAESGTAFMSAEKSAGDEGADEAAEQTLAATKIQSVMRRYAHLRSRPAAREVREYIDSL